MTSEVTDTLILAFTEHGQSIARNTHRFFSLFFYHREDIYSCQMKTHHPLDALSCGLSKVVHKCFMYIYNLGQMQRFCTKNFNLSDCVIIRRNVSLQIGFIAFLAYTKIPEISIKCFLFASRSSDISPQITLL